MEATATDADAPHDDPPCNCTARIASDTTSDLEGPIRTKWSPDRAWNRSHSTHSSLGLGYLPAPCGLSLGLAPTARRQWGSWNSTDRINRAYSKPPWARRRSRTVQTRGEALLHRGYRKPAKHDAVTVQAVLPGPHTGSQQGTDGSARWGQRNPT